jgi:hypothetical protein
MCRNQARILSPLGGGGEQEVVVVADGADVGVDVAELVELLLVGVGELALEVIVVGELGERNNVWA